MPNDLQQWVYLYVVEEGSFPLWGQIDFIRADLVKGQNVTFLRYFIDEISTIAAQFFNNLFNENQV